MNPIQFQPDHYLLNSRTSSRSQTCVYVRYHFMNHNDSLLSSVAKTEIFNDKRNGLWSQELPGREQNANINPPIEILRFNDTTPVPR